MQNEIERWRRWTKRDYIHANNSISHSLCPVQTDRLLTAAGLHEYQAIYRMGSFFSIHIFFSLRPPFWGIRSKNQLFNILPLLHIGIIDWSVQTVVVTRDRGQGDTNMNVSSIHWSVEIWCIKYIIYSTISQVIRGGRRMYITVLVQMKMIFKWNGYSNENKWFRQPAFKSSSEDLKFRSFVECSSRISF